MKIEDVKLFEQLQDQLASLYNEISSLSKKKPDDAINKFKLGFINNLLAKSQEILSEEYLPFADFREFDVDDLPTNSDVVMILSQYLSCFEKLRADNIKPGLSDWYWLVEGELSSIKTKPPQKLT